MEPHKLTYMPEEEFNHMMDSECIYWTPDDLIIPGIHKVIEWPESQKLDMAVGLGGYFWPILDSETPSYVVEAQWYDSIID